jgi:hypothetical protein
MSQDPVPKSDNRTYTVKPLQGTMPAEAADFLCFQRSRRIPSNLTAEHKPGPTCGFLAGEGAHPAEPVEASEGARRGSTPQDSAGLGLDGGGMGAREFRLQIVHSIRCGSHLLVRFAA